jgi:plasmid maintenance system antidote protein VapI
MSAKVHDPITPGEILLTEFLEPLGISQYRLAQATGLPQTRISAPRLSTSFECHC